MNNVIVIYGPTGVGKTELGIKLAKMLNGEVISADSMQVFKHMNIGTAKIGKEKRQGINHYLIDIVEPTEEFSVYNFVQEATKKIDEILDRGKVPIIVGGTGLYINALKNNYNFADVYRNDDVREKYKLLAAEKGNAYVYNILKANWPEKAEKIKENDLFRTIRALEILETPKYEEKSLSLKQDVKYLIFCLTKNRETLYENINKRTDKMFDAGLIDEVKYLLGIGVQKQSQSMQGIGYKEVIEYLDGNLTLDETKELIKKRTRNYAKRQFTFMNTFENKILIDADDSPELKIYNIFKGMENENN